MYTCTNVGQVEWLPIRLGSFSTRYNIYETYYKDTSERISGSGEFDLGMSFFYVRFEFKRAFRYFNSLYFIRP